MQVIYSHSSNFRAHKEEDSFTEIYKMINFCFRYTQTTGKRPRGLYFQTRFAEALPMKMERVMYRTIKLIVDNCSVESVRCMIKPFRCFGKINFVAHGVKGFDANTLFLQSFKRFFGKLKWNSNILDYMWNENSYMKYCEDGTTKELKIWDRTSLHGTSGPYRFRQWVHGNLKPQEDPMFVILLFLRQMNLLPDKWFLGLSSKTFLFDLMSPRYPTAFIFHILSLFLPSSIHPLLTLNLAVLSSQQGSWRIRYCTLEHWLKSIWRTTIFLKNGGIRFSISLKINPRSVKIESVIPIPWTALVII